MANHLPKSPSNTITFWGLEFQIGICKVEHTDVQTTASYRFILSLLISFSFSHYTQCHLFMYIMYKHSPTGFKNNIFLKFITWDLGFIPPKEKCYIALVFFELNVCSKAPRHDSNPQLFNVLETIFVLKIRRK